jgi:hypothetical protein
MRIVLLGFGRPWLSFVTIGGLFETAVVFL